MLRNTGMNIGDFVLFFAGTLIPSFGIAWIVTLALRRYAPSLGLVDQPNSRKVHTTPTPLGGGLGIWAGVLVPFAAGSLALPFLVASDWIPEFARPHLEGIVNQMPGLWILLGGASVLMLLGLLDDIRGIRWQIRLGLQFTVASVCVLWQGWRLTAFIDIPVITWFLSVVWIVALINSFNMLDNMDGLSGGVATIASVMLSAVLLLNPSSTNQDPQLFVTGLLLVLVGALCGFLWHNRPPARIFMGDAGSYFVGFCIAIATLLATYSGYKTSTQYSVAAPLCVMAVPLYDMITVIWIRLREGRSPFHADKNHFSHRLVDLGLTKGQAVCTIYLTTATCGLGALLLPRVGLVGATTVLLMIVCVLTIIAILESTARRKIKS